MSDDPKNTTDASVLLQGTISGGTAGVDYIQANNTTWFEERRKMQAALDLQDNELRELRTRMAGMQRLLDERRVPWISAMAAQLLAEWSRFEQSGSLKDQNRIDCAPIYFCVEKAAEIYAETERQLTK
jgi:hypothetical protein